MLTMVDDRTKGYSLGTTDYLTKPVNREPLHAAVARYRVRGEESAVLLMEDDRATREMIARTLEKSAWSVAEAGHEALDQLARRRPGSGVSFFLYRTRLVTSLGLFASSSPVPCTTSPRVETGERISTPGMGAPSFP